MTGILAGVFLGWALGANDCANVFGTAVSSKMVGYWKATILTAVFVALGAILQGQAGIHTLGAITAQTGTTAIITTLSAAITVSIMTVLGLPISTSQAVVGSILGLAVFNGDHSFSGVSKIVVCWIGTPLGAFIISILLYYSVRHILLKIRPSLLNADAFLRVSLIVAGCYGAYALGANNAANVAGVYVGEGAGQLSAGQAVLIGGGAIALGVVTYSRKVMTTVGKSVVSLDAFGALIAVLSHAVTVWVYAMIGVPVSSTQAIIGAVLGIGFLKGMQTVRFKALFEILIGWLFTPTVAFAFSWIFLWFSHRMGFAL